MFAQAHRTELGSGSQSSVRLRCHMVMDYGAIERYSYLQMLDQGGTIKELPVFVSLDLVIPTNSGDRVASRKERVTNHVAPASLTDSRVFASMHPDPFPILQRTEHHGLATVTLTHGKNIEFMLKETFVHSVEMELGCHDLIIVEQKDELGVSRIDRCVAPYADSDVVLFKINHAAVFGCLGILAGEPILRKTVVYNDDLG